MSFAITDTGFEFYSEIAGNTIVGQFLAGTFRDRNIMSRQNIGVFWFNEVQLGIHPDAQEIHSNLNEIIDHCLRHNFIRLVTPMTTRAVPRRA